MASPVSIALVPVPAPPTVSVAQDFNQLMQNIAAYMAASVAASGQFFSEGPTDPTSDAGLFFNTAQGAWKIWSSITGSYVAVGFLFLSTDPVTNEGYIFNTTQNQIKYWNGTDYVPITQFVSGDQKISYTGGDELAGGWFVQDGRAISSIVGATAQQTAALTALFPSGNLPVGSQNIPPNPALGDIRYSPLVTDQIAIGWVLANGRFTSGFPGASTQQLANLAALYGSQIPTIPGLNGAPAEPPPFVGDQIDSYVAGDDIQNGWVQLDGRTITAIPSISGLQISNATSVYGGSVLPTIAPGGSPVRYARGYIGYTFATPSIYGQIFIGYPANNPVQYFKVFAQFP